MKQYDKIFVPHDPKVDGVWMDDNYHVSHEGFAGPTGPPVEVVQKINVIVITLDELLDLMQEAIEHSYPTLLREKAVELLNAKLK